jgi:hypothetical protein
VSKEKKEKTFAVEALYLLGAVLAASVLLASFLPLKPGEFGSIDLIQYWSAAKLILSGANPYDPQLVLKLEHSVWPAMPSAVLMWNPPFIFPLILVFGLLSFDQAIIFALFLGIALYALSLLILIWPQRKLLLQPKWFGWGMLIFFGIFYPWYASLTYGQISPLLLFALSLSLTCFFYERRFLGGVFLALTLIKPHLLYLVYIELLLQDLKKRDWRAISGFLCAAAFLAGFALLLNNNIFSYYQNAFDAAPPIYWRTPTIGSFLQGIIGTQTVFIRILPTYLTLFAYFFLRRSSRPFSLVGLIPLSLFTAPYGWLYDQLLLVPTVFFLLLRSLERYRNGEVKPISYVVPFLANSLLIIYLIPGEYGQEPYVWFPMLIWVLWLWVCGPRA